MTATWCGCWYNAPQSHERQYLAQIDLSSKTTILASASRTILKQTFWDPKGNAVSQAHYTFPLYDGVTAVSFKCIIGPRTIVGVVKEKQQARTEFNEAVQSGKFAGLFEQLAEASDVFTTKLGNIPAGEKVVVEIVYLGELKQDAETDGVRFTIPMSIAPRYGHNPFPATRLPGPIKDVISNGGINIIVDVAVESGSVIRGIQSPSHPIAVIMGRKSLQSEDVFQNNHASASLALSGNAELDQDFVIIVNAQGHGIPKALLETHPEHGRALMTTLVPKFNLPKAHPEIVFVIDRSGSMGGNMHLVIQALRVFLKSLPLSVKFNICSFGSTHSFLFSKSKAYDESSLEAALSHIDGFSANYGGTELQAPIEATVRNRLRGSPLEIMVLTDGQIWDQSSLFEFINKASEQGTRVFSLGIGSGASTSLVEGMARAGNGFSQFVKDGETIDKRVVRMLAAALTPHISNYSLEVQYVASEKPIEDDFEVIDSYAESVKTLVADQNETGTKSISLFDQDFKEAPTNTGGNRYDHLPFITTPDIIQTPHRIPPLYAFNRTTVYLLFGPEATHKTMKSVILRATCAHGPLELEIPVEDIGRGETIHQLAAKKATQELEEGRGWVVEAKSTNGQLIKEQHEGDWERIVEREAVHLGIQYQVAGKYCSFVAVEKKDVKAGEESEVLSVMSTQSTDPSAEQSRRGKPAPGVFGNAMACPPPPPMLFRISPSSSAIPPPSASESSRGGSLRSRGFGMSAATSLFGMGPSGGRTGGMFGASVQSPQMSSTAAPSKSTVSFMSFGKPTPDTSQQAVAAPAPSMRLSSTSLFGRTTAKTPGSGFEADDGVLKKPSYPGGSSPATAHRKKKSQNFDMIGQMSESRKGAPDLVNTTMEQRMHCVIGLQEFDGSWKKVGQLLKIIGISQKAYDSELSHISNGSVKATALALAWLEINVPEMKDVWVMVADKARGWLVMQDGIVDAENLVESARAVWFSGNDDGK